MSKTINNDSKYIHILYTTRDEQWERLYAMKQRIFDLLKAVKDSADSRNLDKETMVSLLF